MSTPTVDDIRKLEQAGRISRWEPHRRHKPKRAAYLTLRAAREISDPASALCFFVTRPKIAAALDAWVLGQRIPGTAERGEFILPLYPPPSDVWEMKVRAPTVQARLFVRFLYPDALLVTHGHSRAALAPPGAFGRAMDECVAAWDELFPGALPYQGSSIHDYIRSECDDFPHEARRPKRR